MSIALDVALFLREQKLPKFISLSQRGVLLTLMFRLGSNPWTWISQIALSEELNLTCRQLRDHMKTLELKGLIEVKALAGDKRKNMYRVSQALVNYHQLTDRSPETCVLTKKIKTFRKALKVTKGKSIKKPLKSRVKVKR